MRSAWLGLMVVVACSSSGTGGGTADGGSGGGGGGGGGGSGSGDGSGSGTTSGDDPANDGTVTYTMSTATIPGSATGRSVTATVFTPSAGNRALVVISPGFQMARAQYTSYAKHLASWGFAVVLTDYADKSFSPDHAKMAADIKAVIDWSLAQSALAVDADKVAVAGHSLGGKLSTFAASLDARIKAVVGWDPVDSNNPSVVPEKMASIHAAVAVVGETTDGSGGGMPCAPTADNFQAFYAAAGTPAYALTVDGADHMDWVDDGSCTFCGFCTAGTATPELSHTVTRRVDVAWLRRILFDDTAMDVWLDSPPESAVTVQRR